MEVDPLRAAIIPISERRGALPAQARRFQVWGGKGIGGPERDRKGHVEVLRQHHSQAVSTSDSIAALANLFDASARDAADGVEQGAVENG